MTFLNVIVSTTGSAQGRGGYTWATAANRWMQAVGPLARDAIKAKAPVGRGTPVGPSKGAGAGALRNSIRLQTSVSSGVAQAQFIAQVPYAGYVVDGTVAHRIAARGGGYLRYYVGSTPVFSKMVNHPGTKANPFAQTAVEAMLPAVRASFVEIMSEAMGGTP